MSFGIYAIGYLILIAGVAYLAHLMHIPSRITLLPERSSWWASAS